MNRVKKHFLSFLMALGIFLSFSSCHMFIQEDEGETDSSVQINSLTFSKSTLSMKVGSMDYITIKVSPTSSQKDCTFKWKYDESVISCDTSSKFGVTITALKEGQTSLTCSFGGYDATSIITVSGYEEGYEETKEPYIYSNTTVLQTSPGVSEKVFVSLYGGDAQDIDGYTWTIDNSSVAQIQPTGQYCVITAKSSGYARIKITHTKASYPYYMGVYVFEDATVVPYITTGANIVTMNQGDGEQTIECSLVNAKDSSLTSDFKWEIVKDENSEIPVSIVYNGNKAVVTPISGGVCTIRISHPDAPYSLDIVCRVITVVKNVYIKPDQTVVTLNGSDEITITSSLENIKEGEYSVDEYSYSVENEDAVQIVQEIANQVVLKGIANGSTKLKISHPKAAYSREVLCIVTGQIKDAVDASCYITTSQNYIKTKVGSDSTSVMVSLKGGEEGDEKGFIWSVKSSAADGSSDVISLETTNGTVDYSRAASLSYSYGTAYITPKAEGTAVITVSHPKIVYSTEILVKVLSEDAILTEPLYFTGSGILKIVNGEESSYSVGLNGKNKKSDDEQNIKWSNDDSRLTVLGNGTTATVKAPSYGTGETISHITVSHNKVEQNKEVLVLTADDEETLQNMKALYSDKFYYNFELGSEVQVFCNSVGFDTYDSETDTKTDYDFSLFSWTTSDSSIIEITKNEYNPLSCTLKGIKAGSCTLTGSIDGYSVDFKITVYPEGTVQTEPEVYFTTTQNVISISSEGKSETVNINAINLSENKFSAIKWEVENEEIAKVVPNGTSATVTSVSEGETVITVSHEESQNQLKIYVRVGSEYVIPEVESLVYISSQDVMTLLRDDSAQKLQAVLVNYSGEDSSGFSFKIDNEEIAEITAQSVNGIAYIKPLKSGQAEITISHKATEITKKVLVVVGNSAEELAGYVYLTTSSNVVSIGEGNTKSISVSVKNAENVVLDGYTWSSSNQNCVDVTPAGATAVLKANSIGSAIITVKNTQCQYPLSIIVQVVDPIAAAANPYIQLTSSVMTLNVGTTFTDVTADLVGGSEDDNKDFVWSSNDSSICAIYGQNEVGKVRALKSGTTYITVSHPKASYSAQILVVCEEVKSSECSISVPSSIISMKPTDSAKTVTATLVNGSTNDKYNFTWSLDVYDIIDFQYAANVCTITPKQTGSVTITISHPKAAYDQQIIVNVQQYTTFAFPNESLMIEQGTVQFLNMQVPTTTVSTYVEYSVENSNICTIAGTKSVAQITAVGSGTTTVKAKLKASSTGVEQSSAEMMIYVKEKSVDSVYITSSSTIYTVNKGKSQTLSASLTGTGIETTDQYNLKWQTSDSDIIQVTGITQDGSVTGQSIYITALKSGEAIITCSHEKAASTLQFYVVVPGTAEKAVTLNKSYMTILKGSSGTQLKATISNSESTNDYNDLIWSVENYGGNTNEVCRVMGSGQTVTIYPLSVGEATVLAQLPDSSSVAKCTVIVEANKSLTFDTNSKRVQPFHSVILNYTVSPTNAILTWTSGQTEDFFEYKDLGYDSDGNGKLEITGIKAGSGTIACVTDGNAKATCSVTVAWDYEFVIYGSSSFSITPVQTKELEYRVSPIDSQISIDSSNDEYFKTEITENGDGTGKILITPLKENSKQMNFAIIASNPNEKNYQFAQKNIAITIQYGTLTPIITFNSLEGNFSRYTSDNQLRLGDGESVTFNIEIQEENTDAYIKDFEFKPNTNYEDKIEVDLYKSGTVNKTYQVKDLSGDQTTNEYLINKAYVPYYNSKKIDDWETAFSWCYSCCTHDNRSGNDMLFSMQYRRWGKFNTRICVKSKKYSSFANDIYASIATNCYDDNLNLKQENLNYVSYEDIRDKYYYGTSFKIKEDPSLAGKIYTEEEFQKIAWFYCPGTRLKSGQTNKEVNESTECGMEYSLGGFRDNDRDFKFADCVFGKNVDCTFRTSTDKTVKSSDCAGTLYVTVNHLGKDQKPTEIPVYYEVRNCSMNCK